MIWLTWRQHRKEALFTLLGLAVLAAVLVPTGLQMHNAMVDTGLDACLRRLGSAEWVSVAQANSCQRPTERFNNAYESRLIYADLLVFLPLLVGLFWGAPLVAREVEHGTHRLVWTQGVTRLRWALVKLGLLLGFAVAVSTAYALLVSWWLTPLARAGRGRLDGLNFDVQGIAPVGYTLFAVALGVFAGTVVRKVMPAMAITLFGFIGVKIALIFLGRLRYQPPLERKVPITTDRVPNPTNGDWVLSDAIYDRNGKLVERDATAYCEPLPPGEPPLPDAANCAGYNLSTYQPGSRFWLFQYIDTGIYVALAALLLGLAVHQIRRRLS